MQKRITCPECKGNGYITLTRMYNDYCGIGKKACEHCNGKGFLEVPMTNADRIRAKSDEELADLFGHNSICDYVQDHSSEHCEKQGSCDKCLLKWLQQPAEDNEHEQV